MFYWGFEKNLCNTLEIGLMRKRMGATTNFDAKTQRFAKKQEQQKRERKLSKLIVKF
jgi:hypothetical protein